MATFWARGECEADALLQSGYEPGTRYNVRVIDGLELHDVGMTYGSRTLFHGITLMLNAGETLVVTGINGAGKSTLLKVVSGLLKPKSGSIRYGMGAELFSSSRNNAFGAYVAYTSPDVSLYSELTAIENLEFMARLRCVRRGAVEEALNLVALSRVNPNTLVGSYSSGMKQRLKLAASLLGAPPLIVWDEPTATLDADGRRIVDDIIAHHTSHGGLCVLATNDSAEAQRWGDVVVQIGGA